MTVAAGGACRRTRGTRLPEFVTRIRRSAVGCNWVRERECAFVHHCPLSGSSGPSAEGYREMPVRVRGSSLFLPIHAVRRVAVAGLSINHLSFEIPTVGSGAQRQIVVVVSVRWLLVELSPTTNVQHPATTPLIPPAIQLLSTHGAPVAQYGRASERLAPYLPGKFGPLGKAYRNLNVAGSNPAGRTHGTSLGAGRRCWVIVTSPSNGAPGY